MGEIDRARDTRLDRDVALVMEFVERETTGRHTRLVRVTDIEPLRRGSHTGKAGPP